MTILWFASSESYGVGDNTGSPSSCVEPPGCVQRQRFRIENGVNGRERKRWRDREREREREGPMYLLNIHIQPTYASTLRTRRRYAPSVAWKVIHVKQKAKHRVSAGRTRVGEFRMWTGRVYDILGGGG